LILQCGEAASLEVRDYNRAKTGRPFLVNFSAMISFRLRGEIGGAAASPASDVQVGRVAVAQKILSWLKEVSYIRRSLRSCW
jgi:hypothetical protein